MAKQKTWLLAIRGTSEIYESSETRLHRVYTATTEDVSYIDVDYPASIGPFNPSADTFGASLIASVNIAVANLRKAIDQIPRNDRIVIAGYSLGAIAALDAAEKIRYDRIITIACPNRMSRDVGARTNGNYTGIAAGWHPEPQTLPGVYHISSPRDGITSLHPQSPLRRLVPYLWALDLDNWSPWAAAVYQNLTGWHALMDPRRWINRTAWDEALPALTGYLTGGEHTAAYDRVGWSYAGEMVSGTVLAARLVDEIAAR